MTKLSWGQPDAKVYEAGLDRGVLYLPSGLSVPWLGLTSIEESFGGGKSEPKYFEGIKRFNSVTIGDYEGTLSAFACPDEFLIFDGFGSLGNGLFVDDQPGGTFGLSYRTLFGSGTTDLGDAYKIHVLYNLTADPADSNNQTHTDSTDLDALSWDISSCPEVVSGYHPTAHIYFDTRFLPPSSIQIVEDALYGTSTVDARLPTPSEFIELLVAP